MRGIKHFNFPAFDAAKERLLLECSKVRIISPADLDREIGFDETAFPTDYDWIDLKKIGFSIADAVDRDVAAIKQCTAVYMLNGWERSKGACAEKALAEWLGIEIMYEPTLPDGYRFVRIDEPIETGDEWFQNGEWTLTASQTHMNHRLNIGVPLRRKLLPPPLTRVGYQIIEPEEFRSLAEDAKGTAQTVNAEGQTITNEAGGKQSFIAARFDCIPPECLRLLAQCLGFGARKYGKDNWRQIPMDDNLAHAMNHINEFRRGDTSEPHLVNAMARITFALSLAVEGGEQAPEYVHPEMLK